MSHSEKADEFLKDRGRVKWHDDTLWMVRQKRDGPVKTIPEWEYLREAASQIKENVLANLDEYLIEFEKNAKAHGITVLWARDAREHNQLVSDILKKIGAKNIVKSKSILTEECHLNDFLSEQGYDVVDTDLGERIIQLAEQPPSHIVLPAIHLRKKEIGAIFHEHMGTEKDADDPAYLVREAMARLRERFMRADAAITGVNFAVAETGGIVVCTNEGNADLGVHLADVHIACMGIEKIIPRAENLGIFTRLLARSATGQHITTYTSHFHRPRKGASMYVIIVDNGRTAHLSKSEFKTGLKCIRCGACMNTCPVYRRSGGYSYGFTVPGPIGSILAPGADAKKFGSLPFASTLCGSCHDVCPVKINIHEQLFQWRQHVTKETGGTFGKRFLMRVVAFTFAKPLLYRIAGSAMRFLLPKIPRFMLYGRYNKWGKSREVPAVPRESFRQWHARNRRNIK